MSRCIACDRPAASSRVLWSVRGFPIAGCECGLARTELPAGFDPASIYTEAYFQGGHADGYADYASSADELRREFRGVVELLARRTSGRLIEVGCAYGYFLDEARARFEVYGAEIADAARAACVERGHDVMPELTAELAAERGPFDAAVMLDVIDHLPDPGATLAILRQTLRPGAPLVITTGDFASPLARAMGKRWRLMTPPQHLWFFSPATLGALLGRHGFAIERVEHPWKRVPLELIAYQAARYVGAQRWVAKLPLRGALAINLFDAMRVVAVAN